MAQTGFCNICGKRGPLTADHVPPKGAGALSRAELKTFQSYLSAEVERSKIYQNGVKFPTLCGDCNNNKLGGSYDPALVVVSNEVSRIVRSKQRNLIQLPPIIQIRAKPQRIARAVVGHLLAVLPQQEAGAPLIHAPFPDAMRDYFLNKNKPLPPQMTIYYWVYPSELQVAARAFGVSFDMRSPCWVVGDMIKWFPLAYWVVLEKPTSVTIRLPELVAQRASAIDDELDLPIPLRDSPPVEWPERPDKWGANLFSNEITFVAYPRRRRRGK